MLNQEKIENARKRGGEALEERPEEAETALEGNPIRVGYNSGEPLGAESYASYPVGAEILSPGAGEVLEAVTRHEIVESIEDISNEVAASEEIVRKAMNLHGVEEPTERDEIPKHEKEDYIEIPLIGTVNVEYLKSPISTDSRILEHLYVKCGYSVSEISKLLEKEVNAGRDSSKPRWRAKEAEIRGALIEIGLLQETEASDGPNGELENWGQGPTVSVSGSKTGSGNIISNDIGD